MNFIELTSLAEVNELVSWHNKNSEFVVLDTETTNKNARLAKLIDIQMSGKEPESAVIFKAAYLPALAALDVLQVWHNFKYDWQVLYQHGLDLRGKPMRDTMLLHHLVDENASHKLDDIVKAEWQDSFKSDFWSKYKNYTDAPKSEAIEYACKDIVYTRKFYDSLAKRNINRSLLQHVHRLALALFSSELTGIKIDLDYLTAIGLDLKKRIYETKAELYKLGGTAREEIECSLWIKSIEAVYTPTGQKWKHVPKPSFNFSSSAQVGRLLYEHLGLQRQFNKKTKRTTVDDGALELLTNKYPKVSVLSELRNLRTYEKMESAFVTGILEVATKDRVYPRYNPNGTVTGRLSHSLPNIAQIPKEGEWVKLRGIFIPDEGNVLIEFDYAMLEVVIAAHFSQDKNLLRIINEGASKHDITAESLGIRRDLAKTLNFAMQYQCSQYKVAQILGCGSEQAKQAWDAYWATYSGEKAVIEKCKLLIDEGKPIVSPWGRARHFTGIANERERAAAYREGYAALIQGTGSDCTSWAFYNVSEWFKKTGLGRAWCTIHDAILLECKPENVDTVTKKVVWFMEEAGRVINLTVPLKVAVSRPLERWGK